MTPSTTTRKPIFMRRPTWLPATAACLALLGGLCLASVSEAAPAAQKECRHIASRKDRNACYEEQAKKKAAAPADRPAMDSEIDRMKREDDDLAKKLKSICRGC